MTNEPHTIPLGGERPASDERPPRAGGPASNGGDRPEYRGDDKKLHAAISEVYESVGMVVTGIGMGRGSLPLAAAGQNIANTAPDVSDAWMALASRNRAVKAWLVRFTEATGGGMILAMHVGMVAPIVASMGVLDPQLANMLSGGRMAQAQAEVAAAMGIDIEAMRAAAAATTTPNGSAPTTP